MTSTSGICSERLRFAFAETLRMFMACHPETGERTTQKKLAYFLQVRPQTVSLYSVGKSLPNCEQLMKIAEYFNVTADFLMTGRRTENATAHELLGLSENAIQNIKLIKDGWFEDTLGMLTILDKMLADKDFYLAIENAVRWNYRKANIAGRYWKYCEWEAAQHLQGYFMNLLKRIEKW